MHIFKALSASFVLSALALCSQDMDLSQRDWLQPINPESLSRRQNGDQVVQIVQVGDNNGSLKFFPESIVAEPGSVVQFQFYPRNHTITESSFAQPCVPIASNLTSAERPGQRSGFVPVSADTQFRPIYNMFVNDTKPMWIFCGQAPHCQRGMAMVINQNMSAPDKTLERYKAAAAALPLPGQGQSSAAPPVASGAPTPPSASTPATTQAVTTVTPIAATNSGGPALSGTTTSSAIIGTFTGGAVLQGPAPVGAIFGLFIAGIVL